MHKVAGMSLNENKRGRRSLNEETYSDYLDTHYSADGLDDYYSEKYGKDYGGNKTWKSSNDEYGEKISVIEWDYYAIEYRFAYPDSHGVKTVGGLKYWANDYQPYRNRKLFFFNSKERAVEAMEETKNEFNEIINNYKPTTFRWNDKALTDGKYIYYLGPSRSILDYGAIYIYNVERDSEISYTYRSSQFKSLIQTPKDYVAYNELSKLYKQKGMW